MKPSHVLTAIVALLAGYGLGRIQTSSRGLAGESQGNAPAKATPVASVAESESSATTRPSRPAATATLSGAKLSEELHRTFLIGNPITRSLRFAELLEGMDIALLMR